MALSYSAFDLAVLHLLDCIGEALQIKRRGNRHVVRGQKQFYLRFKRSQLGDGSRVGGESGLRNEKVNRSGVKGVSSKSNPFLRSRRTTESGVCPGAKITSSSRPPRSTRSPSRRVCVLFHGRIEYDFELMPGGSVPHRRSGASASRE